jgi:hypothetical protein
MRWRTSWQASDLRSWPQASQAIVSLPHSSNNRPQQIATTSRDVLFVNVVSNIVGLAGMRHGPRATRVDEDVVHLLALGETVVTTTAFSKKSFAWGAP